jgi:hypothetical protein
MVVDSLIDHGDAAIDHHLRFDHPLLEIDVHVSTIAAGSNLAGRVQPPVPGRVQLEDSQGDISRVAEVVEGSFAFHDLPHTVICLHLLSPGDTPPIHTDWFRV